MQVGKVAGVLPVDGLLFVDRRDDGALHLLERLLLQDLLDRLLRVNAFELVVVLEHLSCDFRSHLVLSPFVACLRRC